MKKDTKYRSLLYVYVYTYGCTSGGDDSQHSEVSGVSLLSFWDESRGNGNEEETAYHRPRLGNENAKRVGGKIS